MNTNNQLPVQYDGLLTVATMPKDNPRSFGFDYYDITPVDHDYAGQFQRKANHVFRKLGLPIGFVMMVGDPNNAEKIYDAFRKDARYLGGGTGSGFKNRAPAVLDSLDPLAQQIGAVNVIVKKDSKLLGYNTDGVGFVRGLEELLKEKRNIQSVHGLRVLILGAGGTADAIAFTLASRGAKLVILKRTAEKARGLAERINKIYGAAASGGGEELIVAELSKAQVVVNASTKSAEGPFKDFIAFAPAKDGELVKNVIESAKNIKHLTPDAIVCDINLRSDMSPTLRLARGNGHLIQDGSPMNFHQAVEALWIIHTNEFVKRKIAKENVALLIKEVS